MQGFVWRFQDNSGHATSLQAFEDLLIIANVSVRKSVEDLERFVRGTIYLNIRYEE